MKLGVHSVQRMSAALRPNRIVYRVVPPTLSAVTRIRANGGALQVDFFACKAARPASLTYRVAVFVRAANEPVSHAYTPCAHI